MRYSSVDYSAVGNSSELDVRGGNVGVYYLTPPTRDKQPQSPLDIFPAQMLEEVGGCVLDGVATDCALVEQLTQSGAVDVQVTSATGRKERPEHIRNHGLGLFSSYYFDPDLHGPKPDIPNTPNGFVGEDDVVQVNTWTTGRWVYAIWVVGGNWGSNSEAKILNKAINKAKEKLKKQPCLDLFKNIDVSSYLDNNIAIYDKDPTGQPFESNLVAAITTPVPDVKTGKRTKFADTTFNQNSFFFTDKVTSEDGETVSFKDYLNFTEPVSKKTYRELEGYGKLSEDDIRALIVLHELFHANDVDEKYHDKNDHAKTVEINELIRKNCFN